MKTALSIKDSLAVLRLAAGGLFVGLAAGSVVAVFRICGEQSFLWMRVWASEDDIYAWLPIFGIALISAIVVGRLIRDPAISFGGAGWIRQALNHGQAHSWRVILIPKFVGSFLVKACGVSVGMEGPSIQLGCATAMGLRHFGSESDASRRRFILAGCSAGLAAAFSAPLCGVPYVVELMREKMDWNLLLFLLAGSLGVYVSCNEIFNLGVVAPIDGNLPPLASWWVFLPLILGASLVGLVYAWALHTSARMYAAQKFIPRFWWPMFPFMASALMLFVCPAITGEGPDFFLQMDAGGLWILAMFVVVKLFFTAFCYGSAIPCGVMVPLLTLGCVTGAWYALLLQAWGLLAPEYMGSCMVLGMGAAFGAAERAPITAFFLVAGMSGAWNASMGVLTAAAVGAWLARLINSRPI